jgi:predicted DNA-binding transcriptional regulator AlpA
MAHDLVATTRRKQGRAMSQSDQLKLSRRPAAKPMSGAGNRPPSFMSRKELAWELSVSESTVDELVRRDVIPPAVRLTPGCVRWSWTAVASALASHAGNADDGDPFMAGAVNATKQTTEGRRGTA